MVYEALGPLMQREIHALAIGPWPRMSYDFTFK